MLIVRNLPQKILGSVLTYASKSYRGVGRSAQTQASVLCSKPIVRISDFLESSQDEPKPNVKK